MKILAVNCGSSTLKFELIEVAESGHSSADERRLARGLVDRIGQEARLDFRVESGPAHAETQEVPDHADAIRQVLLWLDSTRILEPQGLAAVGHRIVHGGDQFSRPVLIDEDVLTALDALTKLAPLHNGPALKTIRAARESLGQRVPMVATFDTAFHRSMPGPAALYAIPQDLARKHRIRRYGFHGLAHAFMTQRYAAIVDTPVERTRLVTIQLGNGCSAAAVDRGRSVDTSMGFTPLEGLVMGTRSGDVDPTLIAYLAGEENVTVATVENWLNRGSGLLGVSGSSGDMRELLQAEAAGDANAALAIAMFCYRVRKYIGAYLNVLGGADAVIFGGGIGENSPAVRSRICRGMAWCGLQFDEVRNAATVGREAKISADAAHVQAYVIPVDEAVIIVKDTVSCLQSLAPEGTAPRR
ncbi:MAG: acetate/propionate family kinase [Dehalococcoidia bacterium]